MQDKQSSAGPDTSPVQLETVQMSTDPVQMSTDPVQMSTDPVQTSSDPVQTSSSPVQMSFSPVHMFSDPVQTVQMSSSPFQMSLDLVQTSSDPVQMSSNPVQTIQTSTGPVQTSTGSVQTSLSPVQTVQMSSSPVQTSSGLVKTSLSPVQLEKVQTVQTSTGLVQTSTDPVQTSSDPVQVVINCPANLPSSSSISVCVEEQMCRICHEGLSAGDLFSPCECSGTLASVHTVCLELWLSTSGSRHCELCYHQFNLELQPKPLTEWLSAPSMHQQRRTLCGDVMCFLFITPLASVSGWLCVQGAVDLYYRNSLEAFGLITLTLALFTIYLFWTAVSLRYHVHLFRTWSQNNPRVRLQIPPKPKPEPKPKPPQPITALHFLLRDKSKETLV